MAQGVGFSIDASFLDKIEEADKKMKKLAETTENASLGMISALKNVGTQGLDALVNEIATANTSLSKLGKNKNNGLESTTKTLTQSVDKLNRFNELMAKINGSQNYKNNAIAKLDEDIQKGKSNLQEMVNKLSQLQNKLNFYAKGEGSKALGYVDTTKLQEEANLLMQNIKIQKNKIDQQERERASLQANARLRADLAQKQQVRDAAYTKMQNEKNESIKREAKAASDTAKASSQAYEKYYQDRIRLYESMFNRIQGLENKNRSSASIANAGTIMYDSIYNGKGYKSIQNMNIAIQQMQDAQKKLNLNTDEGKRKYDELGSKIRRIKTDIDNVTGASERLNGSHRNLINTGNQLMRKFALIFSVSQIQGYINKLAQVRGEFELQQRALQAILQNKDEANKIWQQTVDLAVRSPFRVKELVTYTKQLAAYRIETDQLHETTKRLADVSAGLGVDMNRLILAYGQVRAAEYLRGTELRQFTEAGIPLLEELAERFTALRGETVSTAEVFGMISKRMVSFEDVAAVFQKMTDAGGVFYNMQEIQAETLKGQISNLHDSIDLMLNDIGKSNDGVMKGMVSTAKYFVDNWEKVLVVAQGIITAFLGIKLHSLACRTSLINTAASMGIVSSAGVKQLTSLQLLQVGWKKLTASISTAAGSMQGFVAFNAPLLAVTALIGGMMKLVSTVEEHRKQLFEINKKYDELASKANKVTVNFGNAVRNKDFDKQKEALMQLVKIANNDYNMGIDIELRGLSEEEVESKFTNLRNQLQQMKTFRQEFSTKLQEATEWTLQDDIQEDLAQYGSAATQLMNKMFNNSADIIVELRKNFDSLTESEQAALTELEKPRDINESELKYLERIQSAYTTLMGKYQRYYEQYEKTRVTGNHHEVLSLLVAEDKRLASMGINAKALAGYFSEYNNKLIEAKNEIEKFYDTVDINESLSVEEKTLQIKTAIDEQGWNSFTTELAYRLANEKWKVNIGFSLKDPDALEHWQEEYNKFVEGFSTQVTRANKKSDRFNLAKQLSDLWQDKNKVIKAYENGAKEITKTEYESAKKIADELNKSHIWLIGEAIKEKGAKKGKDWWLEMIKGIQSLHKEFLTLNKDLNDVDAKQLAIKKHSGMFDEIKQHLGAAGNAIDINTIDFANENAFVRFLEGLKEIPNLSAQAKLAIEKALTDIKGEAEVRFEVENAERIQREIADMFGNYEMSLELEKLNIPPDFAKNLFNIESIELPDLRKAILDEFNLGFNSSLSNEEIYNSKQFKALSEARQKEIKKNLEKVEELEQKAQEERLKKYIKYSEKQMSERAKVKFKEMKMLDEIEKTFKIEDTDTEEQKATKIAAKQAALVGVAKEAKEELAKLEWQSFKQSDVFASMYQDLDKVSSSALQNMIDQLNKYKNEWTDLPINEMKEVIALMEKLKQNQMEREAQANPFKGIGFMGKVKDTTQDQTDFVDAEANLAYYQKQIDELDIINQLLLQGKLTQEDITKYNEKYGITITSNSKDIAGVTNDIKQQKQHIQGVVKEEKKRKQTAQDNLVAAEKQRKQLEAQEKTLGDGLKMANDLYDAFKGLYEVLGGDEDSPAAIFAEMGMNMANTIIQTMQLQIQLNLAAQSAQGLGAAMNKAMGIVGWIVMGVQLITQALSAIIQAHDKALENTIQDNLEYVEKLQRAYEKLEKQIEDAYSVGAIQTSYDLAKRNMNQQLRATQNMIEMEEKKKKKDEDRIKDWKNEIEDMNEQLRELEEQRLEDLGGLGSDANYKSAAEDFTEAWFDAYREVGDGIGGLEDTFNEFIDNVVKKQLLMRGTNKLLEPVLRMIDKAVDDGMVTTREMAEINEKWNNDTKDALNSYYQSIYQMYEGMITGAGELSELSKGIQNITEPQAAAIEAYLNSMRYFVSDSNRVLKEIQQQMTVGNNNPMVSELKAQTQLIRTIDENLSSVIGKGNSSHTGAYLKVLAK